MEGPKDVQSLIWDPGHHEEVRNSPENKIHIWEVKFRVPEKFGNFPVSYREVSGRFRHALQYPCTVRMNSTRVQYA